MIPGSAESALSTGLVRPRDNVNFKQNVLNLLKICKHKIEKILPKKGERAIPVTSAVWFTSALVAYILFEYQIDAPVAKCVSSILGVSMMRTWAMLEDNDV